MRDLAWVIGSPSLIDATHPPYADHVISDAWCTEQLQNSADWLITLDENPAHLHQLIAARPTRRLGHYFETLIIYWLNHQPDTQIIAANLQVMDASRTIGEYDLLIRTPHRSGWQIKHWEVAVKFYLQTEPLNESWPPTLHTFLGPSGHDRLDLKLARIFQHQLRLGETESGLAALPPGVTLDKTQAFIKGYLFYPASAGIITPSNVELSGISGLHLFGWWCRHGQTPLPQYEENSSWIILPLLRWLAPARLAAEADVQTHAEICNTLAEHFNVSDEALLLVELQRNQQNTWYEIARGFVVHEKWSAHTNIAQT